MKGSKLEKQSVRGKETVGGLKRWSVYLWASLLLCTSAAWGQKFADEVSGEAIACAQHEYVEYGSKANDYFLAKDAEASCSDFGSADVGSEARIGPPRTDASVTTTTGMEGYGYGVAKGIAYDTAVLTPPSGFKGTKVPVLIQTGYRFEIQGSTNQNASLEIGWFVNGKTIRLVQLSNNGSGKRPVKLQIYVRKAGSGFQFQFGTGITAGASEEATAFAETISNFVLTPPTGWTYAWASKNAEYRHRTGRPQ